MGERGEAPKRGFFILERTPSHIPQLSRHTNAGCICSLRSGSSARRTAAGAARDDARQIVSELLRAMGYHVPFVALPGPDGGVDLLAYKDPLGTTAPRIKVQVKHRDQKVNAKDVRELEGLLRKEGDIGLIVSSGGFTSEAEREIRSSTKHIETMDLERIITLWQEPYDKLSQSGKALLPLVKVFFLAPAEE